MKCGTLSLNQPTTMTPKEDVLKALNQLTSLVAGREMAVKTNDLIEHPDARIGELTTLTAHELVKATTSGDTKALKQAQRKLESLTSLKTLATVLMKEVEWD